jgi:hypothetical protein
MDEFVSKPINDCYHVYSDGTRVLVLCDEDGTFVLMMNLIAVVSYYCKLKVLGLEVMTTHFHCVLRGPHDGIQKFRSEMKRLIVKHFNRDGHPERVKNSIWIEADPIRDVEELRRKIIYVFRNCTEAGFEFLPEDYRWGPGHSYCHSGKEQTYKKVSDLGYREQCRMFRTRVKLPGDWEYNSEGMLVPRSYMDLEYLRNNVFVSPRQFIAFLSVKKKDLAEMEAADAKPFLDRMDERNLRKEITERSLSKFGREVLKLTHGERIELASELWSERKTLSIKQLARLTRSNLDVLRAVLHFHQKND